MYSLSILALGHYARPIATEYKYWALFALGTATGALLPDIDHENSRFGRYIQLWRLKRLHDFIEKKVGRNKKNRGPITNLTLNFLYVFKHGGITHTAIWNCVMLILFYLLKWYIHGEYGYFYSMIWWSFATGVSFGCVTHLFGDDVTGHRLGMLFWPFYIRSKKIN